MVIASELIPAANDFSHPKTVRKVTNKQKKIFFWQISDILSQNDPPKVDRTKRKLGRFWMEDASDLNPTGNDFSHSKTVSNGDSESGKYIFFLV